MKRINLKSVFIGVIIGLLIASLAFFVIPIKHSSFYAYDSYLQRYVTVPASFSPLYCVDKSISGLSIASCSKIDLK